MVLSIQNLRAHTHMIQHMTFPAELRINFLLSPSLNPISGCLTPGLLCEMKRRENRREILHTAKPNFHSKDGHKYLYFHKIRRGKVQGAECSRVQRNVFRQYYSI